MLNVVFNNNENVKFSYQQIRCKINSFITKCVLAPKTMPKGSGFRGLRPPYLPNAM